MAYNLNHLSGKYCCQNQSLQPWDDEHRSTQDREGQAASATSPCGRGGGSISLHSSSVKTPTPPAAWGHLTLITWSLRVLGRALGGGLLGSGRLLGARSQFSLPLLLSPLKPQLLQALAEQSYLRPPQEFWRRQEKVKRQQWKRKQEESDYTLEREEYTQNTSHGGNKLLTKNEWPLVRRWWHILMLVQLERVTHIVLEEWWSH